MKKINNKISFILGNEIKEIDFQKQEFDTTTTVLQYLRTLPTRKGVKEGCAEGDCGACTIVLGEIKDNKIQYKAVNSCLLFLPSIHGKQIITVEDLGSSTNLHPIQKAMIDFDGSQCGFCTPGFIMSLFEVYQTIDKPTEEEIIDSITGNLCRCTGYRPIVDAAKYTFAHKPKNLNNQKEEKIIKLLNKINENKNLIKIQTPEQLFFIPKSLTHFFELQKQYKNAEIISGNSDTALRVTKRKELIKQIIDISQIEELQNITAENNNFVIGSGVTMEELRIFAKKDFPALSKMLSVFGAKQVRNKATIGGNIASASPIGDISMTLFAYKAKIVLISEKNERIIPIDEFIIGYRKTQLQEKELIKAIILSKPSKNEIIDALKVSKRSHLDISTVSASFNLELTKNQTVKNIIIAYGGMAEMTKRAKKTEEFLKDKSWTEKTIINAQKILEKEFTPISDARATKEARIIMCKNLLMKFFLLLVLTFISITVFAQHNFLGKSQEFIINSYNIDPEYTIKIDTISKYNSLITCKTFNQYPYYTYEIDMKNNICVSYGFVSKNEQILNSYIDVLDHLGQIVAKDSLENNYTYKIEQEYRTIFYSIKKPFFNSDYYSRRKIFFIIVSEELKE